MKSVICLTNDEILYAISTYINSHVLPLQVGMSLEYGELPKEVKVTITK